MKTLPPSHGVVELEYRIASGLSEAFAAWSQKDALLTWSHPGAGWRMSFERFEFAVGHSDLCRFGPQAGPEYLNENHYLEIVPDQRIIYASTITLDGELQFAGTVAVLLAAADGVTLLRFIEQGLYFDPSDDVESHRAGWIHMLRSLKEYLEDKRRFVAG